MKRNGSIYLKIRKRVSRMSAILVLFVCVSALAGIIYMRGSVRSTGEALGNSAAVDSMRALELQTEEELQRLVKNMASQCDERVWEIARLVLIIAEQATEIASNPDNYKDRTVEFPDPANDGKAVPQLCLAEGVTPESVDAELRLIGNVQDLLTSVYLNDPSMLSSYVASESGLLIIADGDSGKRNPVFDARVRPWYVEAKTEDALILSNVFDDVNKRGLIVTCAAPYHDADGNVAGVAACDMPLDSIVEIVNGARVGSTGHAFMVDDDTGEVVISDAMEKDSAGNIIRENILEDENILPLETAKKIMDGESGIERAHMNGSELIVAFDTLQAIGYKLVVIMDVDEVIAPALESERRIMDMKDGAIENIDKIILIIVVIFGVLFMIAEIASAMMAKRLAGSLAGPIVELSEGAGIIGGGDLDHRLEIKTGDEIEMLADTFNAMIGNIKLITAEKERIGAELSVAREIQASMLPFIFPPFPEREEFDIYAAMLPAKEVGGDFYDFFFIDEDNLAVIIADVSGKGVPAALFMVIAKTLIKNNVCSGKSPEEAFAAANNALCENNETGMFVTAFMGYLNIRTGSFTFVNAGHNPPLIKRAGGHYEFLKTEPCLILAVMPGVTYKKNEIALMPGDTLCLYTDGVTEAANPKMELFSNERLLSVANRYRDRRLKEFVVAVKNEIDRFADGAEQADDITMLTLDIRPARAAGTGEAKEAHGDMKELITDAVAENFGKVMEFVDSELEKGGCPPQTQNQIGVAVEEIFANIVHYAYAPGTGPVAVRVAAGDEIVVEFEDTGISYDPLQKEDPDLTEPLGERKVGGLGIYMVKQIMDSVEYMRIGDKNVLTLRKRIEKRIS